MHKPTLHSHTITHCLFIFNGVREPQAVCQAAPAHAWQRVCLSNRTVKPTEKQADEEEHRTDNSGFAKKRVQWLIEHSTSHQILWYVDSLVLRIPLLRKAANR